MCNSVVLAQNCVQYCNWFLNFAVCLPPEIIACSAVQSIPELEHYASATV